MAKAFRATAWAQGMPGRGGRRGMFLPPTSSLSHRMRRPRPEMHVQIQPSQQFLAVYRRQLTEDPPPHLQVMVHTAFTNTSAKKQEKHPKYHNGLAEAPGAGRSECLDARLELGATGCLCRQLSVPLQGSVGSQRQGVSADHQVQLVSSL